MVLLDKEQIKQIIPHRDPMLLINEVTEIEPGHRIRAAFYVDPDREIFLRHYYYAQAVQEIARQMGLNESTIKTKLRRGRMKLKDILTREGFLREA